MRNYSLKIIRFSEDKLIPRAYTLGDMVKFGFKNKKSEFAFWFFSDKTFIAEGSENSCNIDWASTQNISDYYFVHSHPIGYPLSDKLPSDNDYIVISLCAQPYDNFIFSSEGITHYINPVMYDWSGIQEPYSPLIEILKENQSSEEEIERSAKELVMLFKKQAKQNHKILETFISWEDCMKQFSKKISMFELFNKLHDIKDITHSDVLAVFYDLLWGD